MRGYRSLAAEATAAPPCFVVVNTFRSLQPAPVMQIRRFIPPAKGQYLAVQTQKLTFCHYIYLLSKSQLWLVSSDTIAFWCLFVLLLIFVLQLFVSVNCWSVTVVCCFCFCAFQTPHVAGILKWVQFIIINRLLYFLPAFVIKENQVGSGWRGESVHPPPSPLPCFYFALLGFAFNYLVWRVCKLVCR